MKLSHVIAFIAGAAVGYFAADYLLKDKYEKRFQQEVSSTIKAFKTNKNEGYKKDDEVTLNGEKLKAVSDEVVVADIKEYAKNIGKHDYSEVNNDDKPSEESKDDGIDHTKPYVITEGEVDAYMNYSITQWNYYADGVLTDENNEVVEDVSTTIGKEAFEYLKKTSESAIYVRNDLLELDYEILKNEMTYAELLEEKPYLK